MALISGKVYDASGQLAARTVRVYRRDTGALLREVSSAAAVEGGDPNYSNVSLLLHFNGENDSTTFTDSSGTPKTVTANGNSKISTAQSKFGGSSGYFDGTGDYLYSASNAAFGFGTGDFTIECFIKATKTDSAIVDVRTTSTEPGVFLVNHPAAGNGIAYYQQSIGLIGGSTATNDDLWHHCAWTRAGGTFRMFSDGVKVYEGTLSENFGSSRPCFIASDFAGNAGFVGYLEELRITKGVARYTSNFTPPDAPHQDAAYIPANTLGDYSLTTTYTGEVQVVCLDDAAGSLENDLILRTTPV